MKLVAVNGGESAASKTRAIVEHAISLHGSGEAIDLHALPADGLLGRKDDDAVAEAVRTAAGAGVLLIATPVYRATYTGAVKAFFDRFETGALSSVACVLAATGGIPEHFLAVDTGLRTLVASLGGWSVPTVVYATGADFSDGQPSEPLRATIANALTEAEGLAETLAGSG